MITNHDRSKWIGASDAPYIIGNWKTKTFAEWWTVKLGTVSTEIKNKYTEFGNLAEHAIIDKINELKVYKRKVRKGKKPRYILKYRLRVNYDGILPDRVVEIKTVKKMPSQPKPHHVWQCRLLMIGCRKKRADIWYYETEEEEYNRPYFLEVDCTRLKMWPVYKDKDSTQNILNLLKILAQALRERRFPVEAR